jgi:hypothetical protein
VRPLWEIATFKPFDMAAHHICVTWTLLILKWKMENLNKIPCLVIQKDVEYACTNNHKENDRS